MNSADTGIRRYHDGRLNLDVVILFPGNLFITADLEYITTVLGTCIAVCLYDHERCFGGMNHFLLPEQQSGSRPDSDTNYRYGENAMAGLYAGMIAWGASPANLCAKVFGGARVNGDRQRIGPLNRDFALDFLHKQGIPVIVEHTGGSRARQVLFDPRCGHARVRKPGASNVPEAAPQEEAFIRHALEPEVLLANLPLAIDGEES